jgi:hypothetical protein
MTGDELVRALYAEQGYFILRTFRFHPIGDICTTEERSKKDSWRGPARVIGPATEAEAIEQRRRANELSGKPRPLKTSHRYFYRVEAAD